MCKCSCATLDRETAKVVRTELVNTYLVRRAKILDGTTKNSQPVRDRLIALSDIVADLDRKRWGGDVSEPLLDLYPLPTSPTATAMFERIMLERQTFPSTK